MKLQHLESQFSLLDDLPDALYMPVVTHTHGELLVRIEGILQWRAALLMGQLPEESQLVWPEKTLCRTVLMRLETLDMVQYCQEQEALTDSVLESILEAVSSAEDQANKQSEEGLFNDELAQRQKIRARDSVFENNDPQQQTSSENKPNEPSAAQNTEHNSTELAAHSQDNQQIEAPLQQQDTQQIDDTQQNKQALESNKTPLENDSTAQNINKQRDHDNHPARQIEFSEDQSVPSQENLANHTLQDTTEYENSSLTHGVIAQYAADYLEQEWQDLATTWHELSDHYDNLAKQLGLGWDLSQGILATDGWRNIIQHRKRIKQSPYLQQLVAALGRLREYEVHQDTESFSDTVINAIKRQQEQPEEVTTPHVINDTGGIKRGDDIARMLPSELGLLGHPQLNMLWHVKRAERTLLSYQLQGLELKTNPVEQEIIEKHNENNDSSEQGYGPIIICLDTSASMQGEPEQIAKALVLEALRIAADEQRTCYVYSFGGQEQVLEHELDLSKGGLSKLLNFLQQSFSGGTDVGYALRKALDKQAELAWQAADILLISDGRFPADQGLEQKITLIKKHSDLRIHGVLLGHWRGQAIQAICDPLHRFADIDELSKNI